MGLTEIAFRSRQKASQWVDRVAPVLSVGRGLGEGLADLPSGDLTGAAAALELFRDAAPRRFFAGVESGDGAEILRTDLPAACREVVANANDVCARRFDLLGYKDLSFGEAIDWHLDPVAGRRSPALHWSRINPLDASMVGDSKVTWELNRHQWLLPLGQAYWLTGERRYALEAADLVDDWIRANPYGLGINWTSSLEVAYRLISWIWTFVLIRDSKVLSVAEFAGLLRQVRLHARHIQRYLSRYFAPNTHLTGEALGLFYAGVLFPELREAAEWRRLGWNILVTESARQVIEDGVYFEQATAYQQYTIEIYLHFLMLAARNGIEVPPQVRARVERMVDFLLATRAPDGTVPEIGDSDSGALLPLVRRTPGDCRGTFALAGTWLGRPDFLWAAGGLTAEVLWLLGPEGWRGAAATGSRPPNGPASLAFPKGGYAIMRSHWDRNAHQMIVDIGPLASPVSGAHAHADMLAIQCWAFGEPYLVDPGTFCYTADETWRDHFRGSAAHSTVVVDGQSQADPVGPFAWRTQPTVTLSEWTTSPLRDYVDAFHDSYGRLGTEVRHRRRVLFVKPRFWVLVDDVVGSEVHDVEVRFQFGQRHLQVCESPWIAAQGRRGEGLWLAAFSSVPLKRAVREGETSPPAGWVSPSYGRRRPAPAVIYSAQRPLPIRVVTLLIPTPGLGGTPPRVTARHQASGAVRLCLEEMRETIVCDDLTLTVEPSNAMCEGAR
jgi:hypothetical protein